MLRAQCAQRERVLSIVVVVQRSVSYPLVVYSLLVISSLGGCALFEQKEVAPVSNPLPPLVKPRDAIELEVYIVDRTVGDPLIGTGLWGSLHDLTSLPPEVQARLESQGIRVAMSPARPPRSLQALLSLSSGDDPTRRTLYHRIVIPAGQPTLIPVTILDSEAEVDLPSGTGTRRKKIHHGNCQLQIQADKIADGWATLEVLPVIQHGDEMLRPRATPEEWVFEQGQQTITLYDHRFNVELNEGELIVLGLHHEGENSVGEHFFRGQWKGIPIERHLILRLRSMHRVQPVRAE